MAINRSRLFPLSSFGIRDIRNASYSLNGPALSANETEFLFTLGNEALPATLTYETNTQYRTSLILNNVITRTDPTPATKPRWWCRQGGNQFDGIMIEQFNQNFVQNSDQNFLGATENIWVTTGLIVTLYSGYSHPWSDDNLSSDTMTEINSLNVPRTLVTKTGAAACDLTSGLSYTQSCFVCGGTGVSGEDPATFARYVQLGFINTYFPVGSYANFDLLNGTVTATGAGSALLPTITPVIDRNTGGTWYRISLTSVCNVSGVQVGRFKLNMIASGTALQAAAYNVILDTEKTILICGLQYEENNFVSSYMYRYDSFAGLRLADNLTLQGSNFTNLYKTETGTNTIVCEFWVNLTKAFGSGNRTVFSIDNGANKNLQVYCNRNGTQATLAWTGGSILSSASLVDGLNKVAITVNGTTNASVKICLNGGTVVSGTSDVTPANQTWLNIGSTSTTSTTGFANHLNDVLKKLTVYKSILADATLQSLTT